MSKAILVMDMPESCRLCDLRIIGAYNFCSGTGGRIIDQMTIINEDIKPDWCPLKELPEKMQVCGKYPQKDGITPSYKIGYNACINDILERTEA